MRKPTLIPIAILFISCVTGLLPVPAATLDSPVYELRELWDTSGESPTRFALETRYFVPDDLVGATVDDEGSVYVCDKLTDLLVKIDPKLGTVFSVGSIGDGPEDHMGPGEPVPVGARGIVRADCSVSPKIILYDNNGRFLESRKLDVRDQLVRLFWNGTGYLAVAFQSRPVQADALEFSTHLNLMDDRGISLRSLEMHKKVIRRGEHRQEQDMWNVPRIAVSDDGYCYVQRDLYSGTIECYDRNLEQLYAIDGGWRPTKRTPKEMEAAASIQVMGLTFGDENHTVRRLIARRGGEMWVQPWQNGTVNGDILLERFGPDGVRLDDVRIVGAPDLAGEWIIRGDKLLWMGIEDSDADNEVLPYIRVYDLVAR